MKYLLLLVLSACLPSAPENNYAMQASLDAVVALVNTSGQPYCSGVAVQKLVLTAAHCVAKDDGHEEEVLVAYRQDDVGEVFAFSHPYAVVQFNDEQDFAVLNSLDSTKPPAEALLSPAPPFAGQKVVAIGHPLGLTYTITDGLVSHPRRTWNEQLYFQISSPLYYGNSGGPIYNRYGEVLGLASFLVQQPHLSGAVHWDILKRGLGQ